ncbi:ATP-dependent Clp protease ATP-binding subunit OS=Streptomyces cyaneofuscatus OX=66883 GN=G3I52_02185 PE=4 SV=1 [Streptomyces cyaneofuscatus]
MVVASHNEAQAARHAEIVPAHLILGLLAEPEAVAVRVLAGKGVEPDTLRAAAAAALPAPVDEAPELIPYDADAKKVLELTFREALRLGHNYVGTEHILLALLEFEDGSGVLTGLGLDKEAVSAAVERAVGEAAGALGQQP